MRTKLIISEELGTESLLDIKGGVTEALPNCQCNCRVGNSNYGVQDQNNMSNHDLVLGTVQPTNVEI